MSAEYKLMKGNEAIAHASIRCGVDGFFGYPITPQSEIIETLMAEKPWKTTGMVVLQAESEVASINMLYGGASLGKRVFTSSSGCGISLMSEGFSYIAGSELPCVVVDVMRGGPGVGTIQPSQSDYFQVVKGGGHGDYKLLVLAPATVQEMYDFVELSFELAFKYRNTVMILTDGIIGQMMEKVVLGPVKPRWTEEYIKENYGTWATTGKDSSRAKNIISSVNLKSEEQEALNIKLQAKYTKMEEEEVRCEEFLLEDAEYMLVAYGSTARICKKTVQLAREKGIKLGVLRPITLFPFPKKNILGKLDKVKKIITVEMSAGQMVEDVRLTVNGKIPVGFYGRMGGIVPNPTEILNYVEEFIK